ncbi:hypothetical protein MX572_01080 [Rhodococcus pyridinivorans]|uniref:hypothetical protein n=1 Tax=Rhodococcus pyridinivorans TaxID=103816 RepID=UPI0020C6A592|nr:hypothetical protein [Rhodococcus pyridinivorans]UTM37472.1 hypothetical protein MX572_01080 [Rhodococcus pyridinivorans]
MTSEQVSNPAGCGTRRTGDVVPVLDHFTYTERNPDSGANCQECHGSACCAGKNQFGRNCSRDETSHVLGYRFDSLGTVIGIADIVEGLPSSQGQPDNRNFGSDFREGRPFRKEAVDVLSEQLDELVVTDPRKQSRVLRSESCSIVRTPLEGPNSPGRSSFRVRITQPRRFRGKLTQPSKVRAACLGQVSPFRQLGNRRSGSSRIVDRVIRG